VLALALVVPSLNLRLIAGMRRSVDRSSPIHPDKGMAGGEGPEFER
jgi:hypothetical protein